MIVIDHRRNTLAQLASTPYEFGIEVDLRNHGSELIVTHDAFNQDACTFDKWLVEYRHRFLIVNVKEEGLEDQVLVSLRRRSVTEFFVLDESFPFIRKWTLAGMSEFALRVSEFEDEQTALRLAAHLREHQRRIDWIWVDSFTGAVIEASSVERLRAAGFKLCFVSPELHHVSDPASWSSRVDGFIGALQSASIVPDAVCSKLPAVWRDAFAPRS